MSNRAQGTQQEQVLLADATAMFASLSHEQQVQFMFGYISTSELIEDFQNEYEDMDATTLISLISTLHDIQEKNR